MSVPNLPPTVTSFPYRIAFIGEAPNKDDVSYGKPFSGFGGRLFNQLLSKANIVNNACFLGYVTQEQPTDNDLSLFAWTGTEIQSGVACLTTQLAEFKPNLIVCLGPTSLHLFKEGNVAPPIRKSKGKYRHAYPNSIDSWRGSLFTASMTSPSPGTKCLASFSPNFCLRQYSCVPLLLFDLIKAAKEGLTPDIILPHRDLEIDLTVDEIILELNEIRTFRRPISVDIEGYVNAMSCIAIASSESHAFCIPFAKLNGESYWSSPDDEIAIWRALVGCLTDPAVPKIFQNGLYDRFVLHYSYGIPVFGNTDDTMLKFWEKYCELEKSLGFQCSILTQEPYYKHERKIADSDTHYRYCCRDAAVTFEINSKLEAILTPEQKTHYRFNMDLLNILLYMELRGIKYDTALAKQLHDTVEQWVYRYQAKLDTIAGRNMILVPTETDIANARAIMCYKRNLFQPKKEFEPCYSRVMALLSSGQVLSDLEQGYINTTLGLSLNIKSSAFKTYLYETLQLPVQIDPTTKAPTTDYEALIKIQKKSPHTAVETAIELGSLRTRHQMLAIHADDDGRIRCGYNLVGTETGRITCYTSPTGSGYNLQTIPSDNHLHKTDHPLHQGMRGLFVSDPGYYMCQCDLSGADGWTVGAYLKQLGDPTMLEDLLAKIKPAAVICYMLRHGNASLLNKPRAEIKELLREVKSEDWDYFACKQGIWGTCYLMGPNKLADVILTQSEGKVALSPSQIRDFQAAVFQRYNVKRWHESMTRQLSQKPELVAASGHRRRFYGRYDEILGQALAHLPQANTTYATNLAAWKLWNDPENFSNTNSISSRLRIEPLHQVHDALLMQWKTEDTEWAVGKVKSYFANPLIIAGQRITIPFEGKYGTSWGELNKGTI